MPGLLAEALHAYDLVPVLVQPVDVHIAVEETAANKLLQLVLGQAINVHGLFSREVDELPEPASLTVRVVAVEGLGNALLAVHHGFGLMDAGGLAAAGAGMRDQLLHVEAAPV